MLFLFVFKYNDYWYDMISINIPSLYIWINLLDLMDLKIMILNITEIIIILRQQNSFDCSISHNACAFFRHALSLPYLLWCFAKKVYLSSTIFKRVVLFFCVLVVEMLRSFKGFTCDVFCMLWTSWISLLYVMSCFFECHECLKDVFWTSLRHLWDSWNEHIKKSMEINSLMKWPFACRNRTECL